MATKDKSVIKSTREGRLYIKTDDFFRQEKIQRTIADLLKSDIVRQIEERKKQATK